MCMVVFRCLDSVDWIDGIEWWNVMEWNAESNGVLRVPSFIIILSLKFLVCGDVSLGYCQGGQGIGALLCLGHKLAANIIVV